MFSLHDREFDYIVDEIYRYTKIHLTEKKRSLVISRLSGRIGKLKLSGFTEYVEYLKHFDQGHIEFQHMVDAISTNFTSFFRESHHLNFLEEKVFPFAKEPLNIWSAASSMGQEIYSILISLREYEQRCSCALPRRLFASDISRDALKTASRGVFPRKEIDKLDPRIQELYFLKGKGSQADNVKIKQDLINEICFFRMNLTDSQYHLPMMDLIFLRNVIIYFDRDTKIELIQRLYHYINPGGYLFLGHSESLTGIDDHLFVPAGRTVYQKK